MKHQTGRFSFRAWRGFNQNAFHIAAKLGESKTEKRGQKRAEVRLVIME